MFVGVDVSGAAESAAYRRPARVVIARNTRAGVIVLEFTPRRDSDEVDTGCTERFRSQLAAGDIVDLVLHACRSLAEAQAVDVVHRDVKERRAVHSPRDEEVRWL